MRSFKEYKNRIIITVRILFLVLLFTQLRAGRVYAAAAESASAEHKIGIEADLIGEDSEPAGEASEAAADAPESAVEASEAAADAPGAVGEDSEPLQMLP